MYLTNHTEAKVLEVFRGNALTAPSQLFAGALLSNPGEVGSGTEVSYAGYERQLVTFSPPAISEDGVSVQNVNDIVFGEAKGVNNTITHLGLYDSQNSGNMWAYITLDEEIKLTEGVAPLIKKQEWKYVSMGNFTASFKTRFLNIFRGQNLSGFDPYVGLYTGDPDKGGVELAGAGYERFLIEYGAPDTQSSGQTLIKNTKAAFSNDALETWGTYAYSVLHDSKSGGETILAVAVDTPVLINRTSVVGYNIGSFSISLT